MASEPMKRPIEILLVEDSPGDVWLTKETLMPGEVPKNINTVSNGEQAIDYLRRRSAFTNAVRPDLMLLDLNLPRRNGFEVLREVKSDPDLRAITVVVLTTSQAPVDVNLAYDLNANCYVVKPGDLDEFTATIRDIEHFWMSMATIPTMTPSVGNDERADSASGPSAESSGPTLARRVLWRHPRPHMAVAQSILRWRCVPRHSKKRRVR